MAKSGEGEAPEMATAKELRFGLKLSALFGGKVKMTEIVLIDPVIALPRTPATRGDEAKPQSRDRLGRSRHSEASPSTGFTSRTAR